MKVEVEYEKVKAPIKSVKLELTEYEAKILLVLLGHVTIQYSNGVYSDEPESMYLELLKHMNIDNNDIHDVIKKNASLILYSEFI